MTTMWSTRRKELITALMSTKSVVGMRRGMEMRRDGLKRGQVEDHEKAGFLPDRDHDEAGEGRAAAAEPVVAGQTEETGDLLEKTVAGRVEEEPDIGHRDHGQHGRREEGEAHK